MNNGKIVVNDELIAAYLEGRTSLEENAAVLATARQDSSIAKTLSLLADDEIESLPYLAKAAECEEAKVCVIKCEQYVLQKFGQNIQLDKLIYDAKQADYLSETGVPLHMIGILSQKMGLSVSHCFANSIEDLRKSITEGYAVIVAVDGGELVGDMAGEIWEDENLGLRPDHAIVVMECTDKEVLCYDPYIGIMPQTIPYDQFLDAWDDSNYYMVKINTREQVAELYHPHPIDLSDVVLSSELEELREAIAENAHEVWAMGRQREGWTYGPQRNDAEKKHPDLLPYSDLPDNEKEYDRETAMNTIKLLSKLGYELRKK